MANEISVTTNLGMVNGGIRAGLSLSPKVNQATAKFNDGTQHIATTQQAIVISADITTPGWALFLNTDITNYVEIGVVVSGTFYPVMRLLPGESALLRISSTPLYAKSNSAAVDLRCLIFAN